jgi:hypothetical protein
MLKTRQGRRQAAQLMMSFFERSLSKHLGNNHTWNKDMFREAFLDSLEHSSQGVQDSKHHAHDKFQNEYAKVTQLLHSKLQPGKASESVDSSGSAPVEDSVLELIGIGAQDKEEAETGWACG